MDLYAFAGKRALVTGGSTGIGFDVANKLFCAGANVTLLARDQQSLLDASDKLESDSAAQAEANKDRPAPEGPPPSVDTVHVDFRETDKLQSVVQKVIQTLGGLDILIISGGNGGSEYLDQNPDDPACYEELNKVHVQAPLVMIQAAADALEVSGGNVVVISSIASEIPWPQTLPYNCAKASEHTLVKNLALKYVKQGIRINAVLPACIHTTALENMAATANVSVKDYAGKRGQNHPMQRVGTTAEVTSVVLFLAHSELAGFITGQLLPVDGGLMLTNWFNSDEMLSSGFENMELNA